jgi:hypothetical protein
VRLISGKNETSIFLLLLRYVLCFGCLAEGWEAPPPTTWVPQVFPRPPLPAALAAPAIWAGPPVLPDQRKVHDLNWSKNSFLISLETVFAEKQCNWYDTLPTFSYRFTGMHLVLRIRDKHPDPDTNPSRIQGQKYPDPGSGSDQRKYI